MKWINICLIFFITVAFSAGEVEYFPEGKLDLNTEIDRYEIQWYSYCLSLMQEPSLWEISKNSKNEIYRFLLLRSFNNPVCLRVEIKRSGDALVYIKILHAHQEKLITDEIKSVSKNDVLSLMTKLAKANFWEIKPSDHPATKILDDGSIVGIADGSDWIFEGIKNGEYQAFNVPNPTDSLFKADAMVELGKTFLSLAELEIENLR